MLFAKDLKAALAPVIVALGLLGFTAAYAELNLRDGLAPTGNTVYFAAESYIKASNGSRHSPTATGTRAHNFRTAALGIDAALLAAEESYYVRYDLKGPNDNSDQDDPQFDNMGSLVPILTGSYPNGDDIGDGLTPADEIPLTRARDGQDGDSSGIWLFRVGGTEGAGQLSGDVSAGDWNLYFRLDTDKISLPVVRAMSGDELCYEIELSVWEDFSEARANSQDFLIRMSGKLVCLVNTVSSSVTAPQESTASVAAGFRRFLPSGNTTATVARLATVRVAVKDTVTDADAGTTGNQAAPIQNVTGGTVTGGDVLPTGGVTVNVKDGAFNFGVFKIGNTTFTRLDEDGDALTAAARRTLAGLTTTDSLQGAVPVSSVNQNVYITVDVSGNPGGTEAAPLYAEIPETSFMASTKIGTAAESASRAAGTIVRDGTQVRLGYLTTAQGFDNPGNPYTTGGSSDASYNQRLVITNHGDSQADWWFSEFGAETGVTVEVQELDATQAGCGNTNLANMWDVNGGTLRGSLGANSQIVVPMFCLLSIEGGSRTSAILSVAAPEKDISVVTTQVTRPEGQTDTVRHWPLEH